MGFASAKGRQLFPEVLHLSFKHGLPLLVVRAFAERLVFDADVSGVTRIGQDPQHASVIDVAVVEGADVSAILPARFADGLPLFLGIANVLEMSVLRVRRQEFEDDLNF